jgi:hypothetical protein
MDSTVGVVETVPLTTLPFWWRCLALTPRNSTVWISDIWHVHAMLGIPWTLHFLFLVSICFFLQSQKMTNTVSHPSRQPTTTTGNGKVYHLGVRAAGLPTMHRFPSLLFFRWELLPSTYSTMLRCSFNGGFLMVYD